MSPDTVQRLNAAMEGQYRIEQPLGEGGMAVVYLADDVRHERRVALKVLKPELAAMVGAERFLSEIKTTANLQHPHILPLYDSGEADSFLFYVMPYVEGETLHERLDRDRQLPVDEAVPGYDEMYPDVSPDGRFIAYETTETDRFEVYVSPFPDVGAGKWQISVNGGRQPRWSPEGNEIFFQGPNREMMVAEVDTEPAFRAGTPVELFESGDSWWSGDILGDIFVVAPGAQRFLMARDVNPTDAPDAEEPLFRAVLVNNFIEELKARVPIP